MLISVIMPIYNSEKYLERSIESVLRQKFESFELLLVNDGSTDGSYEICKRYSEVDSRVRVFNCSNSGVSSARNTGIYNSEGDYIVFIDSDDCVEETWCKTMYDYQKTNNNSLIVCGINRCSEDFSTNSFVLFDKTVNVSRIDKTNFFLIYEKWLLNSPVNKLYKRNILMEKNIKFDTSLTLGEDLIFNLDYLKYVEDDIVVVNKPLYKYIISNINSLTTKYQKNYFEIQKYLYKKIYDTMIIFNVDLSKYYKLYCSRYIIDLIFTLNNTFKKDNTMSFKEKLALNKKILKSSEMKLCLENLDSKSINKINELIIKSKSALLQYLYNLVRSKIKGAK